MANHAEFEVVEATDEYIYIKYVGNWEICKSVTNDAEWVVAELSTTTAAAGKRIFYLDTMCNIDELVHDNGIFKNFKFGDGGYKLK